MKLLLPANEVLGGFVSAAVAIPLAMGYGMFAFAPLGEDYFEDGALAGIATAVVVAIACVALGDKTTTVYAPRITSNFFLGLLIFGLAHSDEPAIRAGGAPLVFAIAFSIVLLAGAFESLFGVIELGTLIKFTPQPVMAGFQNAAAALLFLVQLGNVCGFDRTRPLHASAATSRTRSSRLCWPSRRSLSRAFFANDAVVPSSRRNRHMVSPPVLRRGRGPLSAPR